MNKKAFTVLVATMFISMLAMGIVSPFLPIYAEQLGASNLEIGLVQAAFSIAGIGTLLFVGRWSDRLGRKPFLLAGLGVLTLSSVGLMYANSPLLLIVMRFIQGLGATAHLPIAQAYLGDITPQGGEGKWMGYFNAVLFAGVGAGPLLGGVIADAYTLSTTFLFMAILDFLGLIAVLIFLKEMPRKVAAGEHSSVLAPLKSRIMRGVLIQRMTNGIGTSALMTFIPVFANNLGITAGLIGVLIAMRTPVSLLQTYSGILADKWNRRWMVIQGGILSMVAMALVPVTGVFWSLMLVYVAVTLGQSFAMPAITAYIVQEGRTYGMGICMTYFMMAMQAGNGIGPIALGFVADSFSLDWAFYSAGIALLISSTIFFLLIKDSDSLPLKEPAAIQ
jgi:DHA1 family multidrug resistance protein-like MFS transporter